MSLHPGGPTSKKDIPTTPPHETKISFYSKITEELLTMEKKAIHRDKAHDIASFLEIHGEHGWDFDHYDDQVAMRVARDQYIELERELGGPAQVDAALQKKHGKKFDENEREMLDLVHKYVSSKKKRSSKL